MGDGPRGIHIYTDHFAASTSSTASNSSETFSTANSRSHSHTSVRRKLKSAASMLKLLRPRMISRLLDANGQEKVVLSSAEAKSLRSELASLDERESHCKAQIEHINEILRSSLLSGYLFIRMRWAPLPGEPPLADDIEVDDWVPRFVVLHGSCIYLYMMSTDLSPQDSTLVSDIVDVGPLPSLTREDEEETLHCFYILTRQGLRYECLSSSHVQVKAWLAALKIYCHLTSD